MHQYCTFPMDFLRDINLPVGERGLYATLFSLPEDWRFSVRGLEKILPDGKDRLSRVLASLKKRGYLDIIQKRGKNGFYGESDINIWMQPRDISVRTIWQPGNQYPGERDPENRVSVKPAESIIKESNIQESIINESIPAGSGNGFSDIHSLYTGEPRRLPSKNRFNNFKQRQYDYDELEKRLTPSWKSS